MHVPADRRTRQPSVPGRGPATRRAGRLSRFGLVVAASVGIGMLAGACGTSGPGVVSLGGSAGAGAANSGGRSASSGSTTTHGLAAYVRCMRTHGETNMPYPIVRDVGGHVSVNLAVTPSSGFNPRSPRFTAANDVCRHLLPAASSVPGTAAITPGDRSDYLKAAACMRRRGFPTFPEPSFQNGTVTFNLPKSIDIRGARYLGAVAACEKLIPAGLPYSSPATS
jgi:hypothetical protein